MSSGPRNYAPVPAPLPACLRTLDNQADCPPRMSDGRAFTDYRPRCIGLPTALAATYGNEQARLWMTENSDSLMANARQLSLHKNSCNSCSAHTMMNGDIVPEETLQVCTADSCGITTTRLPHALGLGRRFTTNPADTDGAYIGRIKSFREQTFKSRGIPGLPAVCATPEELDVPWSAFPAPTQTPSLAGRR